MSTGSTVYVHALTNAIKAQGVFVEVTKEDFLTILSQSEMPLVVHAQTKIIRIRHKYLTSYRGLAFFTKLHDPIHFRAPVQMIEAKKISIPEM